MFRERRSSDTVLAAIFLIAEPSSAESSSAAASSDGGAASRSLVIVMISGPRVHAPGMRKAGRAMRSGAAISVGNPYFLYMSRIASTGTSSNAV